MNQARNIVAETIFELQEEPDREAVLVRLSDWRDRVHRLYELIERELGPDFTFTRAGQHRPQDERIRLAGLSPEEAPAIDVLEIERQGRALATIRPRHLWMVGANGRLDLTVARGGGRRAMFMLLDLSPPLCPESDWRLVALSDVLRHQAPFTVGRLRDLLD